MFERRRLSSAAYYSPEDEQWMRDSYAQQTIAVHSTQRQPADVAKHVADKQTTQQPFFVMDVPAVMQAVRHWDLYLPKFQPHYALRCNPDPVLCQILADTPGMCYEVTNTEEMRLALEFVDPSRIMYSNPLWTRKTMRLAGECNIGVLVVSSEKELMDAVSYAPQASILISISVESSMREESVATNVGCDVDTAKELVVTAREMRANFGGFSFDVDNSDPSIYYKAVHHARVLLDYAVNAGLRPDTVAVGGGFRAPTSENNEDIKFLEIVDSLNGAIDQCLPARHFPDLRLLASPGRFFASHAFSLCTNVIAKRSVDVNREDAESFEAFVYQTNDGVYGSFGCRMADCDPQCRPLKDSEDLLCCDESSIMGTVVGPTLDGTDVAQRMYRGRQLAVGEWLLWENMGAYSIPLNGESPHPVYYYSGKDHWNVLQAQRRDLRRNDSCGGSMESLATLSEGGSSSSSLCDQSELITRTDSFYDF